MFVLLLVLLFNYFSKLMLIPSWLDHEICSLDMQAILHSIAILDMLPSSDHTGCAKKRKTF